MEVPMTSFLDFVLKTGTPRMTCAKQIKAQMAEPYDPTTDYYKRFRDGVQEMHREGLDKSQLIKIIGALPDRKVDNYNAMISGYKKFLGTKDVEWFEPPRKIWKEGNLQIAVNPEVCLEWGGTKRIIKLYLKADKPSKDRFSSVLALMKHTLPSKGCELCLLDVRNNKLYTYEPSMLELIPLVEAEARALELILEKL